MIFLLLLAETASAPIMPMPAFLAGCWEERQQDDKWTEECWTHPRGGVMIGSGRAGRADTLRNWEWMRVERGPDGIPIFFGSPNGAPAVAFKAIQADAKSITFLNTSHDYPQRVRYSVTKRGIDAETALADGSNPNKWSYRRTAGVPAK
jgi:hypothetical protein